MQPSPTDLTESGDRRAGPPPGPLLPVTPGW
jgi:hypothetical protein